jgi:hypothetical protein
MRIESIEVTYHIDFRCHPHYNSCDVSVMRGAKMRWYGNPTTSSIKRIERLGSYLPDHLYSKRTRAYYPVVQIEIVRCKVQ